MDSNGFQVYPSSPQHLNFYGTPYSPGIFQQGFFPGPEALPSNYKTKRCRHFDSGRCKLGGLCNFAHGEEELQRFRTQEITKEDRLVQPEKVVRQPFQNNSCKIQLLEKSLEQFYEQQKNILEQLKFLTLNLNAYGRMSPEDQVSGIETNITRLFNDAISYTNTLNSVLEVGEDRKKSLSGVLTDKRDQSSPQSSTSGHDSHHSNLSEILNQEEDSLTSIKNQMEFILTQLYHIPYR